MADRILIRQDTASNWSSNNPVLAEGEQGWESDTNKMKIGDGSTVWNSLDYFHTQDYLSSDPQLNDIAGLTPTDGHFIVGDGSNFVTETGATAKTSLGLTVGTDVLAHDANLKSFVDTFTLPTSDGTSGQRLVTDGSGTFSFADAGGGSSFEATASGTLANGDKVVVNSDGTVSVVSETVGNVTITAGSSTTANSSSYVAYSSPQQIASLLGNSNKFVVTYSDNDDNGYDKMVVGTISGSSISFGSPVTFQSSYYSVGIDIVAISSTQIVVSHTTGNNRNQTDAAQLTIGTVSGTSISFSSATTVPLTGSAAHSSIDYSGYPAKSSIVYDSDEDKLIHFFKHSSLPGYSNSNGHQYPYSATVCTVNGSSFTFGSRTDVLAGAQPADQLRVHYDSNIEKTVATYSKKAAADPSNVYHTSVSLISLSGTTISENTATTVFSDNGTIWSNAVVTNDDKIIVSSRKTSDNYDAVLKVGSISGNSITFASTEIKVRDEDTNFSDPITRVPALIYDSTNDKTIMFYSDSGQETRAALLSLSGTTLSFDNTMQLESHGNMGSSTTNITFNSNANKAVTTYIDSTNSTKVNKARLLFGEAETITNLTATNYVGIADAAYSDGNTVVVQAVGSVDDAQSGLTAGQKYYVQTDGTLATTADSPSVVAGYAVSSTELLIV